MTQLNQEQKELIFDYTIGVCPQEQFEQAQNLIASNPEASNLHKVLKSGLSPLDSWEVENCPDELVESIVKRLCQAREESHIKLTHLIAAEQAKKVGIRNTFWVNFSKRFAMAAVFMIVGSIVLGSMKYVRYKAWQIQCQAQIAGIGDAFYRYSNDNNGNMPAVATTTGTPWWMVGYQGQENYSNTRGVWLLPKGEYVSAEKFICPGAKPGQIEPIDAKVLQQLNDFPNRRYVTYSFQLISDKPVKLTNSDRNIIMSDLNPLFENIPDDFSKPLHIPMTEQLARFNSANHSRWGQNVLFRDGNVRFVKSRRIDASNDDIFTLQGTNIYQGVEVPACTADNFLAP